MVRVRSPSAHQSAHGPAEQSARACTSGKGAWPWALDMAAMSAESAFDHGSLVAKKKRKKRRASNKSAC
jgi:hypothetical protein